jgi:hypothetical protein
VASIALVEPAAPFHHVFSFAALPRLGLPSLGAILRRAGHQVRIYCPGLAPLSTNDLLNADLVGISTTTSTAPAAYRRPLPFARHPRDHRRRARHLPAG